jgi:hypothetical protein
VTGSAPAADFVGYWRSRVQFLDVHYHAAPDAWQRRRGVIAAGRCYRDLGGGVVLKNHLGSSVAAAEAARELDLPVLGSVVLNAIAGGPAWRVVAQALAQVQAPSSGRLLVHLPTVTGARHTSRLTRSVSNDYAGRDGLYPCSLCDDGGRLTATVLDLVRWAADHPVVLSTGHADRDTVYRLIEAAQRHRLPRLMLNQPANPMTGLNAADLLALAGEPWLFIEQTALTYLLGYQSWDDFAAVLRQVPNVVYSSDLGQPSQIDLTEWWSISRNWFDAAGLGAARVKEIELDKPLAMLAP